MEEIVFRSLRHLCGGRVYPDHLPQGVVFPAVRYTQIGGAVENRNCSAGLSPRFQIDVYAPDAPQRADLEAQVMAAMAGWDLQGVPVHAYEYEVKMYRSVLDYVW